MGSIADTYELAEVSVSWKMDQHKVSGLKNREKKHGRK